MVVLTPTSARSPLTRRLPSTTLGGPVTYVPSVTGMNALTLFVVLESGVKVWSRGDGMGAFWLLTNWNVELGGLWRLCCWRIAMSESLWQLSSQRRSPSKDSRLPWRSHSNALWKWSRRSKAGLGPKATAR